MHSNLCSSFPPFVCYIAMMARLQFVFNLLIATLLLLESVGNAAPCRDCYTQSRAAHYPSSDDKGTESELSVQQRYYCKHACRESLKFHMPRKTMHDNDFINILLPLQKMQLDDVAMVHWGPRLTMEMYLQHQISIEMD